ncbi:acyl carrier protein [Actinokineospora auranticolor]|uniref:Acyl carrier protein n=1 Tax=Actinokineospora auranticolor TaxID=155976 RepID=A0A2S6GLQ1_9PSEU|nr:acyl carrier protein [Actinokineospora auranticolor]PPK66162.1 acyl carrier protein [Actinokineospora auranticolor]
MTPRAHRPGSLDSVADLVGIVRTELGLPVTEESASVDFDEVTGWDSLHLLSLCSILEQRTGRALSLADVLEARTLAQVYALAAA